MIIIIVRNYNNASMTVSYRVGSRHSRLIGFTTKQNLHDFRYEGGAPINSGFQIPLVNENREYGLSQQARTS